MDIPLVTLLHVTHIVHYGLDFNEVNAKLNEIQSRHFNQAGKDITSIRDPFEPYSAAKDTLPRLYAMCGVTDEKSAFIALRERQKGDSSVVTVDDLPWLIDVMKEAITRYKERHLFFLLDDEYRPGLEAALGEDGAAAFSDELHEFLGEKLTCGNADHSIKVVKAFLGEQGSPYCEPPLPYKAKYHELFAERQRKFREWAEGQALNEKHSQQNTP